MDTAPVSTYYVSMNITLSVDDRLLQRAREAARRQGVSLNEMVRHYLEAVAGELPGEVAAEQLLQLMEEHGGRSSGRRLSREAAYEGRT